MLRREQVLAPEIVAEPSPQAMLSVDRRAGLRKVLFTIMRSGRGFCFGAGMKRRSDRYVSKKLNPLEREAVAMLLAGTSLLDVMRFTGMSAAQIEGARLRQFQHMNERSA